MFKFSELNSDSFLKEVCAKLPIVCNNILKEVLKTQTGYVLLLSIIRVTQALLLALNASAESRFSANFQKRKVAFTKNLNNTMIWLKNFIDLLRNSVRNLVISNLQLFGQTVH